MREKVCQYIDKNIEKTVRFKISNKSKIQISYPFNVPCINEGFTDFYYWDTYFTNFVYYSKNKGEQAKNNLCNMKEMVEKLGFIPNADHLTDRSQPPLFARGVYDYYIFNNKDKNIIKFFIDAMTKEYEFWMKERITPCGLNCYGSNSDSKTLRAFYGRMCERLGLTEKDNDENTFAKNLLAIAESGWDFNPRYDTDDGRFRCCDFAPVDLNSILYDVECKLSYFYEVLGDLDKSKKYVCFAKNRKNLMMKYMFNKNDGLFYDYNFVKNEYSKVLSSASFLPLAMNIFLDKKTAKILFERLCTNFGLLTCEFRGENVIYQQWDFPMMWPPSVYFAVTGLMNCCENDLAMKLAEMYCKTVENSFAKTSKLWEKYNALKGIEGLNYEYNTPEMLGWTAGVYMLFINGYVK